jgi:hypothetical protein
MRLCAAWCVLTIAACDHGRSVPAPRDAGRTHTPIETPVQDAAHAGSPANDGGAAAVTEHAAAVPYEGRAEGRGAEPPIHEFAPHATADTWSGSGTAHLEIAPSDGPVAGTITMPGLSFAVRGRRVGDHVRATLDQVVSETSTPAAAEPPTNAGPSEGLFRGTLDGEVQGTTLHASWEASATAGVHRRRGTIEATAANAH